MRKPTVIVWLVLCGLAGPQGLAASGRVALTPKASTLGLGADVSFKVASRVNLRVLGQGLDYSRSDTVDDIDYDMTLGLRSFGAWVDVLPSKGSFHVSAGLLANGNEIDSVAQLDPAAFYEVGGSTFTGAQLGDLSGTAEFNPTAPYLGVGWGNPFARERRLGFVFDLGVIHQGAPEVTLTSSNSGSDPLVDQAIRDEERSIEDDLKSLEYYPVVSFGLSIRF